MFGFDDILIGAGVGALGSALFGKDPFKGAALGGFTGGLLGGIPAGGWTGGSAKALSSVPSGVGINLAPAAVSDTALSLAPTINPLSTAYGIPELGAYATGTGTNIMAATPSLLDKIKPYATIGNLSGAANIASQFTPKQAPMPSSGGAGVQRGQAPQGTDVMALIQSIKQPERKHITLI